MIQLVTHRPNGTRRVQLKFEKPTRVEKSHKDQVNINNIVARYLKTGLMERQMTPPMYGDFSSGEDFHGALTKIRESEYAFMGLPASVRRRFRNDPGELLDFLADEENRAEAVALGLIVEEQAAPVDVGTPAPAPAASNQAASSSVETTPPKND